MAFVCKLNLEFCKGKGCTKLALVIRKKHLDMLYDNFLDVSAIVMDAGAVTYAKHLFIPGAVTESGFNGAKHCAHHAHVKARQILICQYLKS